MSNVHKYVCINCPLSCRLELVEEDGQPVEVRGADCHQGEEYAKEEFTDPRRVVTTTVSARNGTIPLLPVRTVEAIPKRLVREAVEKLASVTVDAPVSDGQLVLPDILGTGVDVVACRELPEGNG